MNVMIKENLIQIHSRIFSWDKMTKLQKTQAWWTCKYGFLSNSMQISNVYISYQTYIFYHYFPFNCFLKYLLQSYICKYLGKDIHQNQEYCDSLNLLCMLKKDLQAQTRTLICCRLCKHTSSSPGWIYITPINFEEWHFKKVMFVWLIHWDLFIETWDSCDLSV